MTTDWWTQIGSAASDGANTTISAQSSGWHFPINGLTILIAIAILGLAFAAGWLCRSERQTTLDARREEKRRLRTEQGRPTPRHHGTSGNARITRAAFVSETGDADQQ